ncbi:MAG: hypothetical protein WD232_03350, partial [Acidimicrobiales bacterium]
GAPLSWGEAMLAAVFVFFLMGLAYGIVPHQWLTYADNELGWRSDKITLGPGNILTNIPFTITYEVIRDFIAAGIYIVGLAVHVAMWAIWQGRGKVKQRELPTSSFGRPLVKKA